MGVLRLLGSFFQIQIQFQIEIEIEIEIQIQIQNQNVGVRRLAVNNTLCCKYNYSC